MGEHDVSIDDTASSSTSSWRRSPEKGSENNDSQHDESLNACFIGNEETKVTVTTRNDSTGSLGGNEMMGSDLEDKGKNFNIQLSLEGGVGNETKKCRDVDVFERDDSRAVWLKNMRRRQWIWGFSRLS
ncbi:hypothetical protein V6N11_059047 [Hibiscus sabdariffa]|uniref:Uncharacterized protein n=1 Tax=Hibiscus sabdariffa TaxID=183260 RepID=A0ABR2U6P7_9ROSI